MRSGVTSSSASSSGTRRVVSATSIASMSSSSLDRPSSKAVKVPRGTRGNAQLRLPGLGMPRMGSTRRGDMIVRVVVEVPKDLSKEEEEILQRLADLRGLKVSARKGVFSKFR